MYYKDMNYHDQYHFTDYPIAFARTEREMKQSDKYRYFLKLNRSGKAQDPTHLGRIENLYNEAIKEGK
jgi:hypothetical protein